MTSLLVRIGQKGQIVIRKSLRDRLNLSEGALVEQVLKPGGILLRPAMHNEVVARIDRIARDTSRQWPKSLDCVEAVKRGRR